MFSVSPSWNRWGVLIQILPVESRNTSPFHPQWFYRCMAEKLQRRWCAHTGRSPVVWVHLAYTQKHCQHSLPATDREGNLPLYTAKTKHFISLIIIIVRSMKSVLIYLFFSHLHIKESGAISRPLLDDAHVLQHGLMLRHSLQTGPLLHDAGARCGRLLLHPHFQPLLPFHLKHWQTHQFCRYRRNISPGIQIVVTIPSPVQEEHLPLWACRQRWLVTRYMHSVTFTWVSCLNSITLHIFQNIKSDGMIRSIKSISYSVH